MCDPTTDRARDDERPRRSSLELSVYERVSAGCALVPRALGIVGVCDRPECGADMTGRVGRFCSKACGDAFFVGILVNHDWKYARAAAIERDQRCVRCGGDGGCAELEAELHALGDRPAMPDQRAAFDRIRARRRADGRAGPRGGVGWIDTPMEDAEYAAQMALVEQYARAAAAVRARHSEYPKRLEVNHINARQGGGYGPGCAHHLSGLETLCRPCHVAVTTSQLRARSATRSRS